MKRIIILLFCCTISSFLLQAQLSPEMQKKVNDAQKRMQQMQSDPALKAKMQQAQTVIDSLNGDAKTQARMQEAQQQLDAMKKEHPELAGVEIPAMNQTKVPGLDKSFQKADTALKRSMGNAQSLQQTITGMLPKEDLSRHAPSLAKLRTIDIRALAQGIVARSTIDLMTKQKLDKLVKDSSMNIAGTGTYYLSLGFPTAASGYLIASGVAMRPADPYGAAGLGVFYRDNDSPDRALQCFFYADQLLGDSLKSPYVYSNIAWASAYYGDFATAQVYFEKALALSSSFQPALEGEATLAYARGDIKSLFACLAKELLAMTKTAGGGEAGGDAGPSTGFAGTCAGAAALQTMSDGGSSSGTSANDHTFDGVGKDDDSPEQDPPPGADVTYPETFKPIFVNNIKDVLKAVASYQKAFLSAQQTITELRNKRIGIHARFYGQSYYDEHGDLTHDRDYTKFSNLHGQISMHFEEVVEDRIEHFQVKFRNYRKLVLDGNLRLINKLGGCRSQQCLCEVFNQAYTEGNNFLNNGATLWEDFFDQLHDDINWYLKNDAAFVTRVHDPKCNEALNISREMEVREAILSAYGWWFAILSAVNGYSQLAQTQVDCPPVQMGMMGSPDPFSKRPKHIREFPDPNCKDQDYTIGPAVTITENCYSTKFTLGGKIGPFQLGGSYTTNKDILSGQVKDPIYSENNDFDHGYGASAGVAYKYDEVVEVGGTLSGTANYNSKGQATGYTGGLETAAALDFGVAKLGGKASRTYQLDGDLNVTGYSNSLSGSAGLGGNGVPEHAVSGGASEGNGKPGPPGMGISGNGEYNYTSNYDANGNYVGGNKSLTIAGQSSFTTDADHANSEGSLQTNNFGIQANQVIEVVAGQKKAAPITVNTK